MNHYSLGLNPPQQIKIEYEHGIRRLEYLRVRRDIEDRQTSQAEKYHRNRISSESVNPCESEQATEQKHYNRHSKKRYIASEPRIESGPLYLKSQPKSRPTRDG